MQNIFALHFSDFQNKTLDFTGIQRGELPFAVKVRKKQYNKNRSTGTPGYSREQELLTDKISMAISMIKKAMKTKVDVDYILMDSWFFCESFLIMLSSLRKHVDIVAMLKMGKTKYKYQDKFYTAKELGQLMKKRKKVKWIKSLNMYCAEVVVEYRSHKLKLFFCKTSKHGKWHILITTNTKLGILKAYEIYSIRWSIEVFFKEAKQYFALGKSQSQDFDAQIADISIAMIQYNVFSLAKRVEAYETLGGLFKEVKGQITEYTISERIWGFIQELLRIIADVMDGDFNSLIISVMKKEPENNYFFRLIETQLLEAA